ncbi:S41 family peptidase [Pedobacter deserti]|uniref:S41 family peptidase n=1 Tax=Pedobacter deserti TaxID=2817382 RepID=UPI002108D195|nr:S41 family peptidase [Pedobacter sp. SYSU D00382]
MNRKILLFIGTVLSLIHVSASSQELKSKEIKSLIDSTILIMKKNSINSNQVDWVDVRENALLKARNLSNAYELGDVMRYLLRSVNDFHGAFFYRDSVFRYSKKDPVISDSIRNEWKKKSGVRAKILEDNIGYLRVPSMPGQSKHKFDSLAQSLSDSLCFLLKRNPKGIILDLRTNGGGALYPMVLGLEPLLGREYIGSFQTKVESKWLLQDHNFYIDTSKLASILPKCSTDASTLPVVILTSHATGSSGEFLIMAFKGRHHTVTLGETTAGYVTVNDGFKVNNDAFMNLSVGYGKDRNGNTYTRALDPDISISGPDNFNDLQHDKKIIAASGWLKSGIKR